jgi:hypothetical protein
MNRPLLWLSAGALLLAVLGGTVWINMVDNDPTTPVEESLALTPTPGIPWFEDVTTRAGISFHHHDSASPSHYIHETLGSGIGWIDYDSDGLLDLFCVQDGPVTGKREGKNLPTNRLFRNQGDGTFKDVTEAVGLAHAGFHLGCAVADYDNDGADDLLVTSFKEVVLYHNESDGKGGRRFVDVTRRAGLVNPHCATSSAWGDIDNDGLLDLYICNYVEFSLDEYSPCKAKIGNRVYPIVCPPTWFAYTTHKLYRNLGNGIFSDISEKSGVSKVAPAPGLGVIMLDLDLDGWLDIYVANDLSPAYLFHNQGNGTFIEKAVVQGCAMQPDGNALAGMGIDVGDIEGTGLPSLLVTNFQDAANELFINSGNLVFQSRSYSSGVGFPSRDRLGFGTAFLDADMDGLLDFVVVNGHVNRHAPEVLHTPYAQKAQFFQGLAKGKFREVSTRAGPYFHQQYVGRGLARGDYDQDGWPDLAIANNAGPAILLRNATPPENHWLTLELIGDGKTSNCNAIGSRVEIEAGGNQQVWFLPGGGSYLSANSRQLHIGLGKASQAERISVVWPSGQEQRIPTLEGNRAWRIYQGRATPERIPLHP